MNFLWYSHLLESQGVRNSCKISIDPVYRFKYLGVASRQLFSESSHPWCSIVTSCGVIQSCVSWYYSGGTNSSNLSQVYCRTYLNDSGLIILVQGVFCPSTSIKKPDSGCHISDFASQTRKSWNISRHHRYFVSLKSPSLLRKNQLKQLGPR